jgi:hypothetical protein
MDLYSSFKEQYTTELEALKQVHTRISMLRLLLVFVALLCFYFFITAEDVVALIAGLIAASAFPFVLQWHRRKSEQILFRQTLVEINTNEINFLEHRTLLFEDGNEYHDLAHPYAFDLDIFGKKSLFQYLNRTATHIGKTYLAGSLQSILLNDLIVNKQAAIKELTAKLTWRQEILAHAKIANDSKSVYTNIVDWSLGPRKNVSLFLRIVAFVSPVVLFTLLIASLFDDSGWCLKAAEALFLLHLMLIGSQLKTIRKEIVEADKIESLLHQYSLIVNHIEQEDFQSEYLQALKEKLTNNGIQAGKELDILAGLFARVQTIQNAVGSALMNGFFLYHIHSLHGLLQWKALHAHKVAKWTTVIGEIEMLNSYANFAFNNPEFTYPVLNSNYTIQLQDTGHPLIHKKKRICNSIAFQEGNFVILTGSNMSGKSTFLRTLGVNMVLAGAGGPVCASAADIHPLPVLVSMRLSDSLADSESYFFAEVKRLKQLVQTLDQRRCFVLLDEILRGTNSDDKRSGTVEFIKKVIEKQGIGIIATHDLEVCNTSDQYPGRLFNKCFEVEIINDELFFDYKLREGICKNKSATFLMKKMGVI